MIVDVFPFFNEFEILNIRLKILNQHVDKFVIVEHDIDFNNQPKPFRLESKIDHLKSIYGNKIDYMKIHSDPMLDHKWAQEIHQKNNMSCALDLYPDAYFLFGDLDEVPNPDYFQEAIELYHKSGPCLFSLRWCISRWDIVLERRWPGPVFGKKSDVLSAGGGRKFMCPGGSKSMHWKKPTYPEIYPSGWHWSFFGDSTKIAEKLDAVLEGSKIRKKIKGVNEHKILGAGELSNFLKKYCGEILESPPDNLYPDNVKNILLQYKEWWR